MNMGAVRWEKIVEFPCETRSYKCIIKEEYPSWLFLLRDKKENTPDRKS